MNIHHVITALVGASLFASAAAAQEKTARLFKPASPWAMEYADHSCRLIRNFTDGTETVTLAFEKNLPGASLTLGLASKNLRLIEDPPFVRFRYNDDEAPRGSAFMKTVLTDGRDSLLLTNVSFFPADRMRAIVKKARQADRWTVQEEIEMEAASRINSIALTHGFIDNPEFAIGSMVAPLKAIRACVADLVKSWGVDTQRISTMYRGPEPVESPQAWISFEDYPKDLWRARQGGVVPVRLVIDESGKVKDCLVIVEQRGPFEEAVCKGISERGRFKPALDADKKPMRSYWAQVVIFYHN